MSSSGINLVSTYVLEDRWPPSSTQPAFQCLPLWHAPIRIAHIAILVPSSVLWHLQPRLLHTPSPYISCLKATSCPQQIQSDNSGYLMMEMDKNLREALRDWGTKQLWSLSVSTGDNMFGSQFIMIDNILEHIMDLVHFGKIDNLVPFQGQVSWHYCNQWGTQVFYIVKIHFPPITTSARESATSWKSPWTVYRTSILH